MAGIEVPTCQLPVMCPETNYLISPRLSFFTCKMGARTLSSCSEDIMAVKYLLKCLAHSKCLDNNDYYQIILFSFWFLRDEETETLAGESDRRDLAQSLGFAFYFLCVIGWVTHPLWASVTSPLLELCLVCRRHIKYLVKESNAQHKTQKPRYLPSSNGSCFDISLNAFLFYRTPILGYERI